LYLVHYWILAVRGNIQKGGGSGPFWLCPFKMRVAIFIKITNNFSIFSKKCIYVLLAALQLPDKNFRPTLFTYSFQLTGRGKGPAIIKRVNAHHW